MGVAAQLNRVAVTPRPEAAPGFEAIQRHWDPATNRWTAKILPGEYYVTREAESITTVLGSCISACIRDRDSGIGGMNHFMLPEDGAGGSAWNAVDGGESTRYGSYAMERLLNELYKLGARRDRLEVKIFGGGHILETRNEIGEKNIQFAQNFCRIEGLVIAAQDVGLNVPRRVVYFPESGRVLIRHLNPIANRTIQSRESDYRKSLRETCAGNDVELFD
jgi:chemotaxis protein CheD